MLQIPKNEKVRNINFVFCCNIIKFLLIAISVIIVLVIGESYHE